MSPLPPGPQVRSAPTRQDVVAMRRVQVRRQFPQVRLAAVISYVLIGMTLWFVAMSVRAGSPLSWLLTVGCAALAVGARVMVHTFSSRLDQQASHPFTTVFADDALYIDDDAAVWTIPYDAVHTVDLTDGAAAILDTEGTWTVLPLDCLPPAELHWFPEGSVHR